ncbi:hypothetical protein ALO45_200060 [Pseudomonas syringae pv. syringae]|nr:hypothetical protein ALO45_200060 [Pseudomonas syringae pv. syringae]
MSVLASSKANARSNLNDDFADLSIGLRVSPRLIRYNYNRLSSISLMRHAASGFFRHLSIYPSYKGVRLRYGPEQLT